jgi:hypothetical protein
MNTNLDKEKNAITRMWAERKKQIEQVVTKYQRYGWRPARTDRRLDANDSFLRASIT